MVKPDCLFVQSFRALRSAGPMEVFSRATVLRTVHALAEIRERAVA